MKTRLWDKLEILFIFNIHTHNIKLNSRSSFTPCIKGVPTQDIDIKCNINVHRHCTLLSKHYSTQYFRKVFLPFI